MVLPIVKFPNKILRTPGKPVTFPLSAEVKKLTQDMIDTVRAADGIGLAAPQVGKSLRLVIINLEKNGIPTFALYNPRVVSKGFKKIEIEEGCLSLPGIFGKVKRPQKVVIEAENYKGETVKIEDDGWISRVAQHETDHTNGVLIIDLTKKFSQGADIVKGWRANKQISR